MRNPASGRRLQDMDDFMQECFAHIRPMVGERVLIPELDVLRGARIVIRPEMRQFGFLRCPCAGAAPGE